MNAPPEAPGLVPGAHAADDVVAVVVDRSGTVRDWSGGAERLLGYPAGEACGRSLRRLLSPERVRAHTYAGPVRTVRHRAGHRIDLAVRLLPLGGGQGAVVLGVPAGAEATRAMHEAVGRGLFDQERMAVAVYDAGLRPVGANRTAEPGDGSGPAAALRLDDLQPVEEGQGTGIETIRDVLATGAAVTGTDRMLRDAGSPDRDRIIALTSTRLGTATDPTGVLAVTVDISDGYEIWRHLEIVHEASKRLGGSLDIDRTAQELVGLLVPVLGDMASVEIPDDVLRGGEPPRYTGGHPENVMRRIAVRHAHGPWPSRMVQPGSWLPPIPERPEMAGTACGRTVMTATRRDAEQLLGHDPQLMELMLPDDMRASLGAPLFARGMVLGYVTVHRTLDTRPFTAADARLLREIATRAALGVDNARRFTREHQVSVHLQRSLLPQGSTDSAAAQTAGVYRPASGTASVGGDWFDAIPLSSQRIALVVGDVVGHGLQATATMARLRTAVQTLADLDLPPDDLLVRLDDVVQRIAEESPSSHPIGATCLYGVYDPVTRRCQFAAAGHPAPLVVRPDGTVRRVEVVPGPPLGVGGLPFEAVELELEPGSVLALHSDGLTQLDDYARAGDEDVLAKQLAAVCRPDRDLHDVGREIVDADRGPAPADDVTLLLARIREIPADDTAAWRLPSDPAAVADARREVLRQLDDWGLAELAFTTELIVSELVTNAIRYAGEAVGLRLIRGQSLICEVSDTSNSQPRLRRARTTDEGGRGLFLVANLTSRWGSRYGTSGKTIWTEQPIDT
ncbi:SpoIIE family protein phosphatase [Streptantibioticus parmotrematis]|uniref:ATP-binding SpoIIE family protein phosphatase n=1 Tax=Streptantibioticus parmotrematis TaxID=2873249 RepID=UPI0033C34E1E